MNQIDINKTKHLKDESGSYTLRSNYYDYYNENNLAYPKIGNARNLIMNDTIWFVGVDISKAIGYQGVSKSLRDIVSDAHKVKIKMNMLYKNPPYCCYRTNVTLINKIGVSEFISKSKLIHEERKKELALQFELDDHLFIYSRKEIEFKSLIISFMEAFGYTVKHQFYIGKYRADFYIPEINMIIEYDENNHLDYDKDKEKEREDFIIKETGADIVRVDDKNDIYNLGIIAKRMKIKRRK